MPKKKANPKPRGPAPLPERLVSGSKRVTIRHDGDARLYFHAVDGDGPFGLLGDFFSRVSSESDATLGGFFGVVELADSLSGILGQNLGEAEMASVESLILSLMEIPAVSSRFNADGFSEIQREEVVEEMELEELEPDEDALAALF